MYNLEAYVKNILLEPKCLPVVLQDSSQAAPKYVKLF